MTSIGVIKFAPDTRVLKKLNEFFAKNIFLRLRYKIWDTFRFVSMIINKIFKF